MVIMGGPPCQGVSGLNRAAKKEHIFSCPKNRSVGAYLQIVRFLKPAYVITEQVWSVECGV